LELQTKEYEDKYLSTSNPVFKTLMKKSISEYNKLQDEDVVDTYAEAYGGSHVIEGVKDWKKKGYKKLEHPIHSYADRLGKRLSELDINGYISCDENEIFLSHNLMMKGVIEHPEEIYVTQWGKKILGEKKSSNLLKFLLLFCAPKKVKLTVTEETDRNTSMTKQKWVEIVGL
jgi:hypothetical protein